MSVSLHLYVFFCMCFFYGSFVSVHLLCVILVYVFVLVVCLISNDRENERLQIWFDVVEGRFWKFIGKGNHDQRKKRKEKESVFNKNIF